ncbi:hypothetical protein RclHR1_03270006 [Rhizophagus clarus]|uniref:Kinase-like domain-containing protein n=1 Tax=Rhizophagus clarus TaxID=94130 RepID=A0A2Z6R8R4_9GLOM|nr:hypothetical protein RclHR1_03270006 [Rhizophagus clarus]GES74735.1 kinase-like domain-containing protein [Rhizophagus clarus]
MGIKLSTSNISDRESNHKNCSYCNSPFTEKLWCRECDPYKIMKGWTSGNLNIDKFIRDTMCKSHTFLEWVSFDRLTNIKEIDKGGFSNVYSAIWIDGNSEYYESWRKEKPKP